MADQQDGERRDRQGDNRRGGERRGERRSYGDKRSNERRNERGSEQGERRSYRGRDDRRGSSERSERGDRPRRDRNDRSDRPYRGRDNDRSDRPYRGRDNDRGDRPYRGRDNDRGDRPYRGRDNDRSDRQYRGRDDRGERNHAQRGGRDRTQSDLPDLRPVRERFKAPDLPEDVTPEELDGVARMQLKTLQKENADTAARHLAMTARLIDDDPERAHQHALAASRTAGRIGIVRETLGITAYTTGDFALALRELRTYRRITGRDDQLPLMADCERGLGRPEKALELARSVDAAKLEAPVRVELAIAKSGARLDLGQTQEALEELRIPELDRGRAFDYSPALFAAYANVLEELGKSDEAAEWYELSDKAVDALAEAYREQGTEEVSIEEEELPVQEEESQVQEEPAAAPDDSAADIELSVPSEAPTDDDIPLFEFKED